MPNNKSEYNVNKKDKNYPEIKLDESQFELILGTKEIENVATPIGLTYRNRLGNLAIIGDKNTGKTSSILPYLFWQDCQKPCGVTVISYRKEISYTLYAIAKQTSKDVYYINPTIDGNVLQLMYNTDMPLSQIKQNILDYKEAIKKKSLIIIDLENFQYGEEPHRIVRRLLEIFKESIQDVNYTYKNPHMLYIDDANLYQDLLPPFLMDADVYNVCVTLIYQSRLLFDERIRTIMDLNIRNYFVSASLNIADKQFMVDKYGFSIQVFNQLKVGEYLLKKASNNTNYNLKLNKLPADIQNIIVGKSVKIRRRAMKRTRDTASKMQEELLKNSGKSLSQVLNIKEMDTDYLDDEGVLSSNVKVYDKRKIEDLKITE